MKLKKLFAFRTTYPKYDNGWSVTAKPDGKLTDKDGHTYDYLFWDAKDGNVYDMRKGFCVRGEDTVDFLREKLTFLGLNESEMNEFIFMISLLGALKNICGGS